MAEGWHWSITFVIRHRLLICPLHLWKWASVWERVELTRGRENRSGGTRTLERTSLRACFIIHTFSCLRGVNDWRFFSNIRKSKSREADSGRTGQAFGETSHHTQNHSEMTFFQTPLQWDTTSWLGCTHIASFILRPLNLPLWGLSFSFRSSHLVYRILASREWGQKMERLYVSNVTCQSWRDVWVCKMLPPHTWGSGFGSSAFRFLKVRYLEFQFVQQSMEQNLWALSPENGWRRHLTLTFGLQLHAHTCIRKLTWTYTHIQHTHQHYTHTKHTETQSSANRECLYWVAMYTRNTFLIYQVLDF